LHVLFRRVETRTREIDPENYRATLAALDRFNLFTYHLRWRYLAARVRKAASYFQEHLFAERFVRRLLESAASPPLATTRRTEYHSVLDELPIRPTH
jgi:hypothetical protein